MADVKVDAADGGQGKIRLEAWSWKGAFLAVFLLLVFAWGIGFPLRRMADRSFSTLTIIALSSGVLAGGSFLMLSARRVFEFFLSIRVGIAVLVFFILGSIVSVLVHPRDPDKYLDKTIEAREAQQKEDFAWATGYFLYHLTRPYGIGMPTFDIPTEAQKGLDRIAKGYGERIANQEKSGMRTALNGQVRRGEIVDYIVRHRDTLDKAYDVCCFLQLNGTKTGKGAWTSDWFTALMILLFMVVLTNTFRRGIARAIAQGGPGLLGFLPALPSAMLFDLKTLVSLPRIGFLVTHLGVMTALTGGLGSKLTEQRGIVQLSVDPLRELKPRESYRFYLYSGVARNFDPTFAVRLAKFRADYRDNLDIQFLNGAAQPKTIPRYRFYEVWQGRQIGLDYDERGQGDPKTIVRVLEHWPRSTVSLDLQERGANEAPRNSLEEHGPALKLGFSISVEGNQQEAGGTFLFGGDKELSQLYDLPGVRVKLETVKSAEEQAILLTTPFEGPALGRFAVAVGDEATTPAASADIEIGKEISFDTPRGKATLKVLRALPDARLIPNANGTLEPQFANMPAEDVPPLHPGIECLLTDPTGRQGRAWFYENPRDYIAGDDGSVLFGGAKLRVVMLWDRWRSPARARYRMVSGPGLPVKIVKVGAGGERQMELGKSVDLDSGLFLRLEGRADRPKLVPIIQPLPGDPDADEVFFDGTRPPAVRVEVDGPEGKQQFTLAAADLADEAIYANRVKIRLFENTFELPREWKSKLEFLETDAAGKDWVVKDTQTIRVNDYAYYRGYRFFQTDANNQLPGYSGVGIVRDAGIEMVLVGLYAVVFGVAYVFFLKPFILRWRSS